VNDLETRRDRLVFGVRRSVRYHARRRRHFDNLNRFTVFFTVILGSATFASLQTNSDYTWLAPWFGATVTIISAFDLVMGHAIRAREHRDFERRWIRLEREIVRAGTYDDGTYSQLCEQRLEIEADEEPPLRVLDILCHNEQALAEGLNDEVYRVSFIQRWLSQWMDWRADRPFQKVNA